MSAQADREGRLDILYLRNLYWPEDFGGNRYPFEVTARLARRGHRVRVVTGKRPGDVRPETNEAVRISYFPVLRGNPLSTHLTNALAVVPQLIRGLRRPTDVTLVSSYDVGLAFFTLPLRVPSAFIYHSSFYSDAVERMRSRRLPARWAYRAVSAYMRFVERRVLAGAQRIVAVSGFSRDEIITRAPKVVARIRLIPTGVDTAFFAPPADRAAARARVGVQTGDRTLIVVGRLVRVKRYDRAIDVVAGLRRRGIRGSLLVVGDGPERPALEEYARRVQVADRVRFLGFRSGTDLRDALWSSDVQLCTSEFENLSLALIEGMAAGVPVAALPTGGTVDLLTAIDTRLLAPTIDPQTLVPIVADLLTDEARRGEAARRCRAHVLVQHDWERVTDHLEALLRELAGRAR